MGVREVSVVRSQGAILRKGMIGGSEEDQGCSRGTAARCNVRGRSGRGKRGVYKGCKGLEERTQKEVRPSLERERPARRQRPEEVTDSAWMVGVSASSMSSAYLASMAGL